MEIAISGKKLYVDDNLIFIDNYEVLSQLGSGANAVVYLVMNTLLKRLEAMKIWKPRKQLLNVDPLLRFVTVY